MKPRILFIGTGIVPDGRFNLFYEPFLSQDVECYIVSRSPECNVVNYHYYDYAKDEGEAFNYLYDLCKAIGVDVIVTFFEDTVLIGAKLRTALGLLGQKYEQAVLFRNKYAMKNKFVESGIPCARFEKIDKITDVWPFVAEVGYPIVLKPLHSSGTKSVYKCNNAEETQFHLSNMLNEHSEGVLVEEFVHGCEMSCDSMVCKGNIVYSAITCYEPPVIETMEDKNVGLSVVLANDISEDERRPICELAKKVIDAMEFENGFTHMEIFHTSDGYVIGEIAARPPGARIVDLHNISQGKNVGVLLCDIILQNEINYRFDRTYSSGVYFISSAVNGTVVNVSGYDYISNTKEVVSYKIPKIGCIINEKTNSCDEIGHVLFKSRSSRDIVEKIKKARSKINVHVN